MKTRNSALYALGLAAAMTLGGLVTADAQQTRRRPQTRIPVRKDVPAPPRTDTVIVTRVDTVTVRRVDTLTGPTVMRYDTCCAVCSARRAYSRLESGWCSVW